MESLDERVARTQAALYKPNAELDALEQLHEKKPEEFAKLPPAERMRFGHYQAAKRAYFKLKPPSAADGKRSR